MRLPQWALRLALGSLLMLASGCEFHCSVGGPSEPKVVGPLTGQPDLSEFPEDDAVSPVYSDTDTFWIAWAHPDAAEGDAVSGRLIAVDVGAAAPAGTQVIEIPSTLGPDSSGGVFSFTRPDQGWPVGRYRVDVMRAGTSVGSVEFDITRR